VEQQHGRPLTTAHEVDLRTGRPDPQPVEAVEHEI